MNKTRFFIVKCHENWFVSRDVIYAKMSFFILDKKLGTTEKKIIGQIIPLPPHNSHLDTFLCLQDGCCGEVPL